MIIIDIIDIHFSKAIQPNSQTSIFCSCTEIGMDEWKTHKIWMNGCMIFCIKWLNGNDTNHNRIPYNHFCGQPAQKK